MAEYGQRPLLPHGSRSLNLSAGGSEPREKQKNYVFVDEHNRHRRLKVMRACGACRRRKIKCDAATTNTWPCAACVKQQLECVPPSSDQDGTLDPDMTGPKSAGLPPTKHDGFAQFDTASNRQAFDDNRRASFSTAPSQPYLSNFSGVSSSTPWSPYRSGHLPYTPNSTGETFGQAYSSFPGQNFVPALPTPNSPSVASVATWSSDKPENDLAEHFHDLKIEDDGIAPYIANQQHLAQVPAIEEKEYPLPPQSAGQSAVSIPPEMMPSNQQAMTYFECFFANIHPYVPVVDRQCFYQQWHSNKYSISPLILEGMFACSSHLMNKPEDGARWLALAARHEESYKEAPRLSTIQGLILVLKAREAVPKRGYYYRSWTLVQFLISMAKDLGLHKHLDQHRARKSCRDEPVTCNIKSRVWHTLFHLELMIGGPQGKFEFNVDLKSVSCDVPQSIPGIDESEVRISQDQIQFVRIIKNVRITSAMFAEKKQQDANLAQDSEFVSHNADYDIWTEQLPRHLQISYSDDGSPPWIPFHFAANLHCYHLLSSLMHRRPQLDFSPQANHQASQEQMMICYIAATKICRLHEAILQSSGLNGLLCMMRGINMSIYTVLTCTMLHLVAITSPVPALNQNAKDYFSRHMRILEQCSKAWPMDQMQAQIDSLRQAFSADLSRPFELRQSFPYGSPSSSEFPSTPSDGGMGAGETGSNRTPRHGNWGAFDSAPLTPSNTMRGPGGYSSLPTTANNPSYGNAAHMGAPQQSSDGQAPWDPSDVLNSWTSAFNPSALDSPSPGLPPGYQPHSLSMAAVSAQPAYHTSSPPSQPYAAYSSFGDGSADMPATASFNPAPQVAQTHHYMMPQQQSGFVAAPPMQSYMSPAQWQELVARSCGDGLKRRWDGGLGDVRDVAYKRMK